MLYLSHLDLKFSNLAHFVCPVNGKVGEYRYKLIPGNRVPGINTLNHKQVKLGGGGKLLGENRGLIVVDQGLMASSATSSSCNAKQQRVLLKMRAK